MGERVVLVQVVFWFGWLRFRIQVWFGLVWFGLDWFGLVWFGLVWFGLVFVEPAGISGGLSVCVDWGGVDHRLLTRKY